MSIPQSHRVLFRPHSSRISDLFVILFPGPSGCPTLDTHSSFSCPRVLPIVLVRRRLVLELDAGFSIRVWKRVWLQSIASWCPLDVANPDSDSSFMSICAEELAIAGIGVYIHRDALCLERPGWEVLIAIVGSLIEGHVGSVAMIPLLESSIFSLGKPGTSSAVTF